MIAFLAFASLFLVSQVLGDCAHHFFEDPCLQDAQGCCFVASEDQTQQTCEVCTKIVDTQQVHLQSFYDHFHVEDSPNYEESWKIADIGCPSEGVISCNVDGDVTVIQLVSDELWGSFDGICQLSHLDNLHSLLLTQNFIHGQMSSCISDLSPELERFMISHNHLRGPVPGFQAARLSQSEVSPGGQPQCQLSTDGTELGPESNCFDCPFPENIPFSCNPSGAWNQCEIFGTAKVAGGDCPPIDIPAEPTGMGGSDVTTPATTTAPACATATVAQNACLFPTGSATIAATMEGACTAQNNALASYFIAGKSVACLDGIRQNAGCAEAIKGLECSNACPTCDTVDNPKPCLAVCNKIKQTCTEAVVAACALNLDARCQGPPCRPQVLAKAPPPLAESGATCSQQAPCKFPLACSGGKCAAPASSMEDVNPDAAQPLVAGAFAAVAVAAALL